MDHSDTWTTPGSRPVHPAAQSSCRGTVASMGGPVVERVLGWIALATAAVVVGTGAWLSWNWYPVLPGTDDWLLRDGMALSADMATVHRLSSWTLVGLLLVFVGLRVGRSADVRRAGAVLAVIVGSVVGLVTGPPLAWQQLAVWAVTTGDGLRGLRPFFDMNTQVRFALIDNVEVAPSTMRTLALVHIVLVPLLLAGAVWLSSTRRRDASET